MALQGDPLRGKVSEGARMPQVNDCVTWKANLMVVLTVAIFFTGLVGGFVSWGWGVHAEQPHRGAVRDYEFQRLESRVRRLEDHMFRDCEP